MFEKFLAHAFVLISRWVDCLGNVHGRVEGRNASAEALLIGSHLVMFLSLLNFPIDFYILDTHTS